MCQFKLLPCFSNSNIKKISIHLMCQFKKKYLQIYFCEFVHFNTSYVSVQDIEEGRKRGRLIISIHLMCQFKIFGKDISFSIFPFQYILCVSSRKDAKNNKLQTIYFNTSYVSVQAQIPLKKAPELSFQYILCVSSRLSTEVLTSARFISIHLMCQFKQQQI